uniref:Uncharacterized protein n=1 Tax=Aegilops tauschii subsp. strangulata TaxID=200361 RepID=A0A452YLS8_AEGTS
MNTMSKLLGTMMMKYTNVLHDYHVPDPFIGNYLYVQNFITSLYELGSMKTNSCPVNRMASNHWINTLPRSYKEVILLVW